MLTPSCNALVFQSQSGTNVQLYQSNFEKDAYQHGFFQSVNEGEITNSYRAQGYSWVPVQNLSSEKHLVLYEKELTCFKVKFKRCSILP